MLDCVLYLERRFRAHLKSIWKEVFIVLGGYKESIFRITILFHEKKNTLFHSVGPKYIFRDKKDYENFGPRHAKTSSDIFRQRRPRSDCASAQSDQGLHCPLMESLVTVEHNEV